VAGKVLGVNKSIYDILIQSGETIQQKENQLKEIDFSDGKVPTACIICRVPNFSGLFKCDACSQLRCVVYPRLNFSTDFCRFQRCTADVVDGLLIRAIFDGSSFLGRITMAAASEYVALFEDGDIIRFYSRGEFAPVVQWTGGEESAEEEYHSENDEVLLSDSEISSDDESESEFIG
jgi:hypothetical protein